MKWSLFISLCLIGSSFIFYQNPIPERSPKYLELDVDWVQIEQSKLTFSFQNPDSTLQHEMFLLAQKDGTPLLYYSPIQTPVCIDGLCKPVYIELYWDLLGEYVGYNDYPDQLLTKFDHELFSPTDYQKLHELLLNPHSILDRRNLSDLYDIGKEREKAITFKGKKVDGISGATKKEIKNSIVEGALYSCYTLWHLAYKDATEKISKNLALIYNDTLENHFLQSSRDEYHTYALKQLSDNQFTEKINLLLPILKNGTPLIRSYILKKMPKSLYGHPLIVAELYQDFYSLDFNSKTLLIKYLNNSNSEAVGFLAQQLKVLSKNQLKQFLAHLDQHPTFQTEDVLTNLKKYMVDSQSTYAYLVEAFFEKN